MYIGLYLYNDNNHSNNNKNNNNSNNNNNILYFCKLSACMGLCIQTGLNEVKRMTHAV